MPDTLLDDWTAAWPRALAAWSRFTRLRPPAWCRTPKEEKAEGLTGSFAMIRLNDTSVVISLRQVAELHLERFAVEVLAHEIGHHVLAPGDLTAHGRCLARVRAGLPGQERHAPMVANLYTDLLINDRLQRQAGLDMAGVYRALHMPATDGLWQLYMRTYEILWALPRGTLAPNTLAERTESDARLAARLVRVYGRDWLDGTGRFAALCLPYLMERDEDAKTLWLDTVGAGAGGHPSGLASVDPAEAEGVLHPAFDPALSGIPADDEDGEDAGGGGVEPASSLGGPSGGPRGPGAYGELLRQLDPGLSETEIIRRYYRERASPHLVPFPSRRAPRATEPQIEGLDVWSTGDPLEAAEWTESLLRSPVVVPGVTTVQRAYGETEGTEPERLPVDLYVGIDCSGSMPDPRLAESYPVVAGTIVALSALRAGARAKAVLSGEPGRTVATDGFVRDERSVMDLLTGYLGTGTAFGIHRLAETFDAPRDRPAHILILTDHDLFWHLDSTLEMINTRGYIGRMEATPDDPALGWNVAERALAAAGGGGTVVLHSAVPHPGEARLEAMGWAVHRVHRPEDLEAFARAFSRAVYASEP